MKIRNASIWLTFSFVCVFFVCLAYGEEDRYLFESKFLTLSYSVSNEIDITIEVYHDSEGVFYTKKFTADYGQPTVEFMDINGDNYEDILLKLNSEGEYDLIILMNKENKSFIEALPQDKKTRYVFNYDVFNMDLYENKNPIRKSSKKEYLLKKVDEENYMLCFDHLFINGELFENVAFYSSKKNFRLRLEKNPGVKTPESGPDN